MTLRPPLQQYWKPPFDEARTASTWKRLAARRRSAPRAARRWVLAVAGTALVAVVVLIASWPAAVRPARLTSRDPAVSVAPGTIWASATRPLVFDDDSRVTLSAEARLQVLTNEGTRFTTLLLAGSAHFDVHPDGPRRWEIETALASVEVVGTAFTVSLHDHRVEVEVERGVVLVHGEQVPGRMVRLTAGERIVAGPPVVTAEASATPVAPPIAPVAPPTVPPVAPVSPVHVPRPAPDRAPDRASARAPATLVALADVIAAADKLSSQGDPAGAARLLEGVRGRAADPAAGLAVFTLGRLYLDALDKPEAAAAAFEEVIARGSPRSLLEDAYARRVEAWARAHRPDRAGDALAAYAAAYPQGRRLAALRTLLGAP